MKGVLILAVLVLLGIYYFSFVQKERVTKPSDIRLLIDSTNKVSFELLVEDVVYDKIVYHYSVNKDTFFIDFWQCSKYNFLNTDKTTDTSIEIAPSTKIIHYCSSNVAIKRPNANDNNSSQTITYQGNLLYYIRTLKDSSGEMLGEVYAERLPHEDSVFKRIYVFRNDSVAYYIGDGILTNNIDSKKTVQPYYGYKFSVIANDYFEFTIKDDHGLDISDEWRIEYNTKDQRFEAPYDDF
jgi:hypothetical protein